MKKNIPSTFGLGHCLALGLLMTFAVVLSAQAVDGNRTGGAGNYWDTTKWSSGTVASGTGAIATFSSTGAVVLDAPVTLGRITGSWNSGTSLTLSGPGQTLTFATTTGTPVLSFATWFSRYDYLINLTIAGTQGLSYMGASNVLVLQSGMNWSGFSGGLNLVGPGNGDGGIIYAQSANALPATTLTLTPGGGSNGYRHAKLVLNSGANQTVGALNSSIAGTSTAYISSYTSGSQLTGGTPSGTNANGFATITIGADNGTGIFRGKIGTGFNNGANTEDAAATLLNIVKTGTGTQTFAGTNNYIGTTTVSQGTLLIDATYDQGTGANAGRIFVSAGATLGGTGTIKLSDTNGGTTGFSISGTIAPGDSSSNSGIGTLTIDGSTSARSVAAFETGATLLFRLGTSNAASKFALTGGTTNDVFFNNNVVNFTDMSGGSVSSGAHVIFSTDVAGAFNGLTTDASGTITAGLTIGTGLSAFTNTSLQVVGNNIVLNLTNPNAPVPVAFGFDLKSSSHTGMSASEVAGPSGARFANWNNFNVTASGGSLTNMVDSNGAAVTGVNASFVGGSVAGVASNGYASPTNDVRMWDTIVDQTDGNPSTITVTGIPYSTYDVYFYLKGDGSTRGGRFTVNGTTYYLRGGALPTSSGSGYTQSTDTTYDAGADTIANYVKFTGLSGTLTASFLALNQGDSVMRLKVPGFQIVGSVSPPTVAPSAPAGVTITATSMSGVTLQWNAASTATQYQIFRSTTAGSFDFNNPLATVAATSMSYSDTSAVSGTTYYYVVRAVNSVGSSSSSSEVSTPPPNLDSVAVSSPVLWPGGSTTISWAIPNATSLTIEGGGGPQSYPTTGSFIATLNSTTTYTFTATNAQGQTTKSVLVTVVPKPATRDSLWQWSVPITEIISGETGDYPRAFLYIPPGCQTVRGVIIGQHNMLEEAVLEHAAVRQGLADAGMAAIWVTPAFDAYFNFTANPNTPAIFQSMMDKLAAESGYAELSKTPVVWTGHSAMGGTPYNFVAWDAQNSAATGAPRRAMAALSVKGAWPGPGQPTGGDSNTPNYVATDLDHVPLMFISGEYEDANGRAASALAHKNAYPNSILSFLADNGGGHFDWNDRICEYIGMYLRKLGQYRLPATAAADGTATLQTINTSTQGWLADRWRKGQNPTANPAAVGQYTGTVSQAFWFFDQEHAETTHNHYLPVKTQYQLLGYTQNGTLVNQSETHQQVNLSFTPDPAGDGLTFKLGTTFLDTVPAVSSRLSGWTSLPVGSSIGHASGTTPILISRIAGPVEQLSPDTFAVRFGREGTNNLAANRSRDMWLMAAHPGDSTYVRAVQQSLLRIPLPLTSGAAQAISFPVIANQINGTASINLSATTSGTATYAGATVSYYVREGAAKVNGATLEFTTLPPRTKFPAKVSVVATQYGRNIAPLLQTATPVKRTFWIHQNALEQWRYENFGTLNTDANGEQSWTLAANSGDNDDPDADGQNNAAEFAASTDPLNNTDVLRAAITNAASGPGFVIHFLAKANRAYVIEYKNALTNPAWQTLATIPSEASDTEVECTDPTAALQRFYRVRTPAP